MNRSALFSAVLLLGVQLIAAQVQGADDKVTLMLGGKFCDVYLDDVEHALKKIEGVKAIDFKAIKGYAVVTVEAGKVKPRQLVAAVNQVKGSGWHCAAEAMPWGCELLIRSVT